MVKADLTLDTLGLFCPMPVILTSKKIKQMAVGEVLEVLSDDEGIKRDMPAWCKSAGQEYIEWLQDGRVIRVYVRKAK